MLYTITHPMADEISVQSSTYHMCRMGLSSEIAFFQKGIWVTEPIEPFVDYFSRARDSDTAVYGWVPNELIDAFLSENGAVAIIH